MTEDLIFYNKEGYPYNFEYDTTNKKWSGKLLFDHNGSDTFKTLSMYIFEKVNPIDFSNTFNLNELNIYNKYGLSFIPSTTYTTSIYKIEKSINDSTFYTKWIYGNNINTKYPLNTFIKFDSTFIEDVTNDFSSSVTFNVIANKSNAILISTKTSNDLFTNITLTGITISSVNTIKINSFKDANINTEINKLSIGTNLSITNSTKNDSVVQINSIQKVYTSLYNYIIPTGLTSETLSAQVTTFTDRELLYSGDFTINSSSITFTSSIAKKFESGQNIIFEDLTGELLFDGYTFDVLNINTSLTIATTNVTFSSTTLNNLSYYYASFSGSTSLNSGDIIFFNSSSTSLNTGKNFKISNVTYISGYTTLELEQQVFNECSNVQIVKTLKNFEQKTIFVTGSNLIDGTYTGNVYLTTNVYTLTQPYLSDVTSTINAFIQKYKNELATLGISVYYLNDQLFFEGLYDFNSVIQKYFNLTLNKTNLGGSTALNSLNTYSASNITERHYISTENTLYTEKIYLYNTTKLVSYFHEEILLNLNDDGREYGFSLYVNDKEYYIAYNENSGTTTNTIETIKDFISKYYNLFYNNGVILTNVDNTLIIDAIYPSIALTIGVKVNLFSTYSVLNATDNLTRTLAIVLSSNSMTTTNSIDLLETGLSTGMIISLSGSTNAYNNVSYNILNLSENKIELSYQGIFISESGVNLNVTSSEFIRKPRESAYKDIYYKVSWEQPYNTDMFIYDVSGVHLNPPTDTNGAYIESLRYTGNLPLFNQADQNKLYLNSSPNSKIENISNPKYQQTIFDNIQFLLPQYDSSTDFNYTPEPLQVFLGFNSTGETITTNTLKIEKIENIIFSGVTESAVNYFEFANINGECVVTYKSDGSFIGFNSYGFEDEQNISFSLIDSAASDQKIFTNVETYKIKKVFKSKMYLDTSAMTYTFNDWTSYGKLFKFKLSVEPKIVGEFSLYGQTEIEDERLNITLRNVGLSLGREEECIFSDSDVAEYGIDYVLLNAKRKELLSMYPEIYNYLGSYKSIINAINFFGYSDLELYEYYKYVNKNSPLYKTYFRVHMPDMLDRTVEGWTDYDYITSKKNKNNYVKTNLFNLTYKITDTSGNNVTLYSLEEVQLKLQKLKLWLRNKILPLSANLVDLTGVATIPTTIYSKHDVSNSVVKIVTERVVPVINFNYAASASFNTNYLVNINFYVINDVEIDSFQLKIKTFYKDDAGKLVEVQYHNLFKNDLNPYNFNVDKLIDPYIYVETVYFDGSGVGYKNNRMFKFDEPKQFYLVNNNFSYKHYPRLSNMDNYYIIDDDNQMWLVEKYSA